MTFTENEMRSLIAVLEAAAGGAVTPNQAATARGLAARFRDPQDAQPDDRQAPATSAGTPEPTTRIDVAAIFAKRRAVVERAMAANPAARLGNGAK